MTWWLEVGVKEEEPKRFYFLTWLTRYLMLLLTSCVDF